jgi:pilus assembly protein Flp/PilA
MSKLIKRLATEEEAGTAVEYGLITAVIAVGLIVALVAFRNKLRTWFNGIGDAITAT